MSHIMWLIIPLGFPIGWVTRCIVERSFNKRDAIVLSLIGALLVLALLLAGAAWRVG
jgi:hypothetical protein